MVSRGWFILTHVVHVLTRAALHTISPKCRMIPVKDRPQMEKMVCPINDLIKANGGRKQPEEAKRTKKSAAKPRATKNSSAGRGKKRKAESSEEEEESALSDLSDESD